MVKNTNPQDVMIKRIIIINYVEFFIVKFWNNQLLLLQLSESWNPTGLLQVTHLFQICEMASMHDII